MNNVPEEYQTQSPQSKRCLELLGSGLSYQEMKPICLNVFEMMKDDGLARTDRAMPTHKDFLWQVKLVQDMNRSDGEWIEYLDWYKNENGVKLFERIPLTEIQQKWSDYISCESDDKPDEIDSIAIFQGVQNVNNPDEEIPF